MTAPADALLAAPAAAALGAFLLWRARARLPHASPNARSLHAEPVPRVGGLAIWAGAIPAALIAGLPGTAPLPIALAMLAVGGISLLDDWRGVHPVPRLLVQLAAAATAASAVLSLHDGMAFAVGVFVATIVIAWSANAFNFMDGTDGLAALCAMLGFGAYGIGAYLADLSPLPYFALVLAIVPFAAMNWPPARMFMGDCGAVPLGFLAAVAGIAEWQRGSWPGWFPLLVFLPFLADATVTLVQRTLRRERVWEAHRSHYYQRLHQMGAGHAGTLRIYGALMAGAGASAVATLALMPSLGWAMLALWCTVTGAFFRRINYHWQLRTPSS